MIRVRLAALICSPMCGVAVYCSTPQGVIDQRWTWIFMEV